MPGPGKSQNFGDTLSKFTGGSESAIEVVSCLVVFSSGRATREGAVREAVETEAKRIARKRNVRFVVQHRQYEL